MLNPADSMNALIQDDPMIDFLDTMDSTVKGTGAKKSKKKKNKKRRKKKKEDESNLLQSEVMVDQSFGPSGFQQNQLNDSIAHNPVVTSHNFEEQFSKLQKDEQNKKQALLNSIAQDAGEDEEETDFMSPSTVEVVPSSSTGASNNQTMNGFEQSFGPGANFGKNGLEQSFGPPPVKNNLNSSRFNKKKPDYKLSSQFGNQPVKPQKKQTYENKIDNYSSNRGNKPSLQVEEEVEDEDDDFSKPLQSQIMATNETPQLNGSQSRLYVIKKTEEPDDFQMPQASQIMENSEVQDDIYNK